MYIISRHYNYRLCIKGKAEGGARSIYRWSSVPLENTNAEEQWNQKLKSNKFTAPAFPCDAHH